jgi:glucosamine--fructose-6-phosphate aminotransferase (isomerizing)
MDGKINMITQMEKEALETPQMIAKQWAENKIILKTIAERLHTNLPQLIMTVARGSSDHAATFGKYVFETQTGIITVSAALSVFTLYKKTLPLKNCLVIGISQSGNSQDVTAVLTAARESGAITIALVNEVDSPLAHAAEYVIPTHAGKELAVAATKTYIGNLSAFLQLLAFFTHDKKLIECLQYLPERLAEACTMDWSAVIEEYRHRHNTLLIGRGYGFGIVQEAALKFKETSYIHAEAFSGAELLHGPFGLVTNDFPLFFMAQNDETLPSMLEMAARAKACGAKVMFALPKKINQDNKINQVSSIVLPLPESIHPMCDPLLVIQGFYIMMARLSIARGYNPDAPFNLTKVTQTW